MGLKQTAMAKRRMILGLRPGPLGEGAARAEDAGLDFVLLGGRGEPEPAPIGQDGLTVAAFLMNTTRRIGLAAAVSTAWAPFNVARALASFDHLSAGRGSWLPWPAPGGDEGARFAEHLDVVMQLFDSWDDDALILDQASGVFADRDRVRRIRHSGVYYAVDGPLNAPRPPQGRPVLFQPIEAAGPWTDVALVDLDHLGACSSSPAPLVLAEVTGDGANLERLTGAFARGDCDGFLFSAVDLDGLFGEIVARLPITAAPDGDFRARLSLARPWNRFAAP